MYSWYNLENEDYDHLGMDRVLILLQEKYSWPKMADDIRKYIRQCDWFIRFKKPKEKDQLYPIIYPILVVTDHFTWYAQCYITSNQTVSTIAKTLVDKFFTIYGWPDKILTE